MGTPYGARERRSKTALSFVRTADTFVHVYVGPAVLTSGAQKLRCPLFTQVCMYVAADTFAHTCLYASQTLSAERATLTTGPLPLLPANPTLSVPTHSPTPILTGLMAGLTWYSQRRVFWLRGRLASVAEEQTGGGEARELWRQIDEQVTVCVPGMTRKL